MMLTKQQEDEHQAALRGSLGDRFGISLLALLQHDLEKVQNQMVDCPIEEFQTLQGQAQAYRRQLKYLKERSSIATMKV